MKRPIVYSAALTVAALSGAVAADPVDFLKEIKPILEVHCVSCHGVEKPKGNLRLITRADAVSGGANGPALVPGQPQQSPVYTTTILPHDDDAVMPPKGGVLAKFQTERLRQWIEQGADWPEGLVLQTARRVDFVKEVQPILEASCVACHREGHAKGGVRLDERELALTSGYNGPSIVPGNAAASTTHTSTILPADHDDLMPPASKGGPLPKEQIDLLRDWINQGALWPEGVTLKPKATEAASAGNEAATIEGLHERIVANTEVSAEEGMKPYTGVILGTEVTFNMVPIPGGEYLMGSPEGEPGRKPDEGPQHRVRIEPFWMGQCEVTWNEYELFMYPEHERRAVSAGALPSVDGISRPTRPYTDMSFNMGKDGFPAISMTQHAANTYCKWLSAKTGHFYRLPTEAEWEYACRAGTTTAYSFGDDVSQLGDYAWYVKNSEFKYQKVGQKKPNPWGLHDMHGNVIEWCLDQYEPDYHKRLENVTAQSPWIRATKPYPHSARGGSWDDDPAALRSAARRGSSPDWKMQDPQLPKSIWYHTDAQFLGFRVVRPLKVPSPEEMARYWNSGVEAD